MATSKAGPGCAVLFGLVFLLAGGIPVGLAGWTAVRSNDAASWTETRASLVSVDLRQSDDTAEVEATYRYQVDGEDEPRTGTRVSFMGGSDNIGSWQRDTHQRLSEALRNEATVACWYDPADPAEAVLDRELRGGLLAFLLGIGGVFMLVGGAIIAVGILGHRRASLPAPQAGQMLVEDRGAMLAMCFFAVVWNAISWTAIGLVLQDDGVPMPMGLLIWIFPLVGILVLIPALLMVHRAIRHGRARLRLDDGSLAIGTRLRATLLSRTPPRPEDRVEAAIHVVRRVESGSGKNRSTREVTLWRHIVPVDGAAGRDQGGVWGQPLELPLPSDLPPTADDVVWRLHWRVVRPGPDVAAVFTLPVAAGAGGEPLLAAQLDAEADRADPLAVLATAKILVSEDRGEVMLSLPAFRNPGLHISGLVSALLFAGGAAALAMLFAYWTIVISGPLVLLALRGAIRSCLYRSIIRLGQRMVVIEAGWVTMALDQLKASEVATVESTTSMSSDNVAYHNLRLTTHEGRTIPIARGVPAPAAKRIVEMIDAALGRVAQASGTPSA